MFRRGDLTYVGDYNNKYHCYSDHRRHIIIIVSITIIPIIMLRPAMSHPQAGSWNGKRTIVANDPKYNLNMGQRTGLSYLDAKLINREYCNSKSSAAACHVMCSCNPIGRSNTQLY